MKQRQFKKIVKRSIGLAGVVDYINRRLEIHRNDAMVAGDIHERFERDGVDGDWIIYLYEGKDCVGGFAPVGGYRPYRLYRELGGRV